MVPRPIPKWCPVYTDPKAYHKLTLGNSFQMLKGKIARQYPIWDHFQVAQTAQ